MKRILLIAMVLFLSGCTQEPPKKPWVITSKYGLENRRQRQDSPDKCRYEYMSADGRYRYFTERDDMYAVGDTIR